MGKWTEDLGRELTAFFRRLAKEERTEPEKGKKKPLTIREIGLPRLMLMLVAGIVLLILTFPDFFPGTGSSTKSSVPNHVSEEKQTGTVAGNYTELDAYVENAEIRLETLLRKVDGVGDVEVMITAKSTGESIPLKDTPYEKNSSISEEESGGKRTDQGEKAEEGTVMVENSDGTTQPYVVMETLPEIEGVVVLAQGGGSSEIKKEIVEAVQVLFDIKAHKIKVMKMN